MSTHEQAMKHLNAGGLVKLPEWNKAFLFMKDGKVRLTHAVMVSTELPGLCAIGPDSVEWPYVDREGYAGRKDWELLVLFEDREKLIAFITKMEELLKGG